MLNKMRKIAGNIVGLFLIGLLVVAFAAWGISDTFTGFSNREIARVGDRVIDRDMFRFHYDVQLRRLSDQFNTSLSAEQARAFGIDRQVLGMLIGFAALSNLADDLGLADGDDAIARRIIGNPTFHGASGQFDETRFRQILYQNGLSEDLFVAQEKYYHMRGQLMDSVVNRSIIPDAMMKHIAQHAMERRIVSYFLVTPDMAGSIDDPSEAELQRFFAETSMRFAEVERRRGTALIVTPSRFAETIEVSRQDIAEEYEHSIDEFSVPEKRKIDQLVLSDDKVIARIETMLVENRPFNELVKAAGQSSENTDWGLMTRDDFLSDELGARAFSLKSGEVSEIIDGPLGKVVLRVGEIQPGKVMSLDEVSDVLRARLVDERAFEEMIILSEKIDDMQAAGKSLEDIADVFNLDVTLLDGVLRDGRSDNEDSTVLIQQYSDIVPALFNADIGGDIPMIETHDGSFLWLQLNKITPRRDVSLDEKRADVMAQWKIHERQKKLESLADYLVKRGNETGVLSQEDLHNKTLSTSEPIGRDFTNEIFSARAVDRLFSIKDGEFATVPSHSGSDLIVMQIKDIIVPVLDHDSDDGDSFDTIEENYRADMLDVFVNGLKNLYGVEVNQKHFDMAMRGSIE